MRRASRSPDAQPEQELLPEAELEVLALVRERGEVTAAEVRQAMAGFRPMTHASVATLLGRLQQKGLLERRKGPIGKAYLYSATRAAERPVMRAVGRMLQRVFAGDTVQLVASALGTQRPTRAQLEELHRFVGEELAKRPPGSGRGRGE